MPSEMEMLQRFSDFVLTQAANKRNEAVESLKLRKAEELEKAENEFLNSSYNYIQAEIAKLSREKSASVSQYNAQLKKQLLQQRSNIFNELFDEVVKKVIEFTNTPRYEEYIKTSFKEAIDTLGVDMLEGAKCTINYKDAELFRRLGVKGIDIIHDNDHIIGGFILRNDAKGHVVIDCTLNQRIEKEKRDFLGTNELMLG